MSLWGCFPTRPRRSSPSIKQTPPPATREFECKPARLKPVFSKCAWKQRKSFHEGQNKRSPTTIPERSSERPFLYAKMPTATSVELSPLVGSWPKRSWCLEGFLHRQKSRYVLILLVQNYTQGSFLAKDCDDHMNWFSFMALHQLSLFFMVMKQKNIEVLNWKLVNCDLVNLWIVNCFWPNFQGLVSIKMGLVRKMINF